MINPDPPEVRQRIKQGFNALIANMEAVIRRERDEERERHRKVIRGFGELMAADDPRPMCKRLNLAACQSPTCPSPWCSRRVVAERATEAPMEAPSGPAEWD